MKNKTAMSCGVTDLRPENAVILRCFSAPTHPLENDRANGWGTARENAEK
jgi:hypothetical protein